MADTLQNIPLPANQWVDLYAATGIAVGQNLYIQNLSGMEPMQVAISPTEPLGFDGFRRLEPSELRETGSGVSGVWAVSKNVDGECNVGLVVADSTRDVSLQKTAFQELLTAELQPIGQIDAVVGFTAKVETFEVNGGSVAVENNAFLSISGTNADGTGSVVTKRQGKVRPGQGLLIRGSAAFDTPQPDSFQEFGIVSITNRAVFGYNGIDFGISTLVNGQLEIQELTVTTPAGGNENATVTVNGIAYTVPLTAATAEVNAYEIATSLTAQDTTYVYRSNGVTVTARSITPSTPVGAFAFTSATAVATWVQQNSAAEPTRAFIPQSEWNGFPVPDLDPQFLNYYQVRIGESAGRLEFSIEDPGGAGLVLVHTILSNNLALDLRPSNNIFRAGWLSQNRGNTTSVTVRGIDASIFVEGKIFIDEPSRADQNANIATTGVATNILTLRSRDVFKDDQNRHDAFGLLLSVTSESTKATFLEAVQNADISGDVIYEYVDKENSIIEVYKGNGVITGGRLVASAVVGTQGVSELGLKQIAGVLLSGDTVTVSARLTGGNDSEVSCSATWQEDL